MSGTPLKKRRATILVTGPQSKKTIYEEDEQKAENEATLQDIALVRQRLQNEMAVVNTASGIEILMQIVIDELDIIRHGIRENGERMRRFLRDHFGGNQIRAILVRIFSKSISSKNMLEYNKEAKVILNEICEKEDDYKMPTYTLNDIEEVLLSDDLEDGVIQRRTEKWARLPIRRKSLFSEFDDDPYSEFRKLNVPMSMTFDEEDEDRLSMPSTRTQMTTDDQMASIQNQLAMLSKQLLSLQKGGQLKAARGSSRASSRKGGRRMEKKTSLEISSTSSSSDFSEDEGKGPSVCSPSLSSHRKVSETTSVAPMALAPPPPPPPPMMLQMAPSSALKEKEMNTPVKPAPLKPAPKSLPAAETIVSNRPYLTDIANGRSLLKKTIRSPGGSPSGQIRHQKRAVSSFEAALRDRFRGFHGDTSFSEQEENGDEDVNATWDE
ncbi:unnamed protein product [Caenorhabditis sp. 36 PRJEB53466]|nr:unnamed protein product [Caenorhabditis sp. 36 PRJEB53466]